MIKNNCNKYEIIKLGEDFGKLYLALIIIPLIATLLSIKLKGLQWHFFKDNIYLRLIVQAIIICGPLIALGIFLSTIPVIPSALQIAIPLICFVGSPFIICFEACVAQEDIIEIFDVFGIFD